MRTITVEPKTRNRVTGPALRTFFNIAEKWGLSRDQQIVLLGKIPTSTYHEWKKKGDGRLSNDTLERISYILGIFKALQILIPDIEVADGWIKRPNRAYPFGGKSALDRMLSGQVSDLFVVRQYLDAQLG